MDFYLGQIVLFGFNFVPINFMQCNGQLLAISQYDALFALLSTTYGGDGIVNFALPNLNGRVAVGQGQDQMQNYYAIGQMGGQTNVTLTPDNVGMHQPVYVNPVTPPTNSSVPVSSLNSGGTLPFMTQPPYLALNYCICVNGIFPPRP